ncbi:MAG: hypothetical protein U5K30_07755 [Acidimicrobiales bacterium]|nr:hypothetical protein [Acidimicrobiales bacterium]
MIPEPMIVAYTDVGTVVTGWGITTGVIAAYAWWMVRRGRLLSRSVPPEDRRWS